MPPRSPRLGLLLAFASSACGAQFVEQNPPRLVRSEATYTASSTPDPTVWLLVSDLYLEDPSECPAALSWLEGSLRSAVSSIDAAALELPPISVSGCTQPVSRSVDGRAIDAEVQQAEANLAGRPVRAIIVYANNIALRPPPAVGAGLAQAQGLAKARGAQVPLLWMLLASQSAAPAENDGSMSWTYAFDPGFAAAISTFASPRLPLQSDKGFAAGPLPVFPGGKPAGVRQFKLCSMDKGLVAVGFAADGSAVQMNPLSPPSFGVQFAPRHGIQRSDFTPMSLRLEIEACLDHCDRFFDYSPGTQPVRWNAKKGCLLQEAKS
jgi:hypothetical protein